MVTAAHVSTERACGLPEMASGLKRAHSAQLVFDHAGPAAHATKHPRVSILILTYNRPGLLSRALQSALDQTLPDIEVIVVHDGTERRTQKVMRDWQQYDRRVRYFHRERPGNIAEATNYGLARARGEYIAILDDDDFWASREKLEKQVRFLDEHPEYAGCGGGVIVVDENERESLRYMKPESDEDIKSRALIANPIAHSTAMYRKSAISKLSLYDESLAGFQDWDVWLRMGRIGKLYNFPEYFAYYTLWNGGGSFQQTRNNTWSALRIILRHRREYPHFAVALSMGLMSHIYAHLPASIKRETYAFLSRLKKSIFAQHRPAPGAVQGQPAA